VKVARTWVEKKAGAVLMGGGGGCEGDETTVA